MDAFHSKSYKTGWICQHNSFNFSFYNISQQCAQSFFLIADSRAYFFTDALYVFPSLLQMRVATMINPLSYGNTYHLCKIFLDKFCIFRKVNLLKILLLTPPFVQWNTAYAATPFLNGCLLKKGYVTAQADLSIEVVDRIFCSKGLQAVFEIAKKQSNLPTHLQRIVAMEAEYLSKIDPIMRMLRNQDSTLAQHLCHVNFVPQGRRFDDIAAMLGSADECDGCECGCDHGEYDDHVTSQSMDKYIKSDGHDDEYDEEDECTCGESGPSMWESLFGRCGDADKARFLATRFIEDIGDLIQGAITPHFAFVRYAESLGVALQKFAPMEKALQQPLNLLDTTLIQCLQNHIEKEKPDVVGITIPFPGNLYAALRCGQYLHEKYPQIKVVMGGGYVNTELRDLKNPAVFDYVDFITLDDGEAPLLAILEHCEGRRELDRLVRTYIRQEQKVRLIGRDSQENVPFAERGTPNYQDLPFDKYLSLFDMANPMHRLWSDGRWNKLQMAHGCYWHRCGFCDTSLDYICRYEPHTAKEVVDQMAEIIAQTGQTGFHFVDEAAPPQLLEQIALEILSRKMIVTWWANIRFEKAFTLDLCHLLAASGCVAVAGGLETPCDRVLHQINKGITIEQATAVLYNFAEHGILAHAYLMYGCPTQTAQEIINGLEVVRQLFQEGILDSAYWHRFALTVHSPIAQQAGEFGIQIQPHEHDFAFNELAYLDTQGANPEKFRAGLEQAVYNYMNDLAHDRPVHEWFDFKTPRTTISPNLIPDILTKIDLADSDLKVGKLCWIGSCLPTVQIKKSGKNAKFIIHQTLSDVDGSCKTPLIQWMLPILEQSTLCRNSVSMQTLRKLYEEKFPTHTLEVLFETELWEALRSTDLLIL